MNQDLDIFKEKTQYDIERYFTDVQKFLRLNYSRIIRFYSSQKNSETGVKESFQQLQELIDESNTVLSILQNYSDSLDSRFWEIMELVDDIKLNLQYIENTPKWLRSSLHKGRYSYSFEGREILQQRETLELLSQRLGSSNREEDWYLLALRNNLPEEGYTVDGGVELVTQYFNNLGIILEDVVDSSIVGEKVYGLDIDRVLTYRDDDLSVLTYKETVVQAVRILVSLRQGDNPQYPQNGLQSSLISGSNKNSIPYHILLRQLYSTFQNDDTLRSLRIMEIENKQDTLSLDIQVETRVSETVLERIIL